jgi:hypothetical protein
LVYFLVGEDLEAISRDSEGHVVTLEKEQAKP